MQAVSNEFKELAKSNARVSLAKFVIKDSNTEVDGETIIDGFIQEMTCDDTSIVGNVMAKNLETSIYNNFTNDFIGKEIYAYTGQVLEDGTEEYVPRGTFIIDESEEDVSSGALKLKGLDYTIKMNVAWEDPLDWENNTYTLGDFAKAVCEFCDLELETEEFSNSDYVLTEQPAFEGYQCRYVMQRIAEIATSNVFISPEDKVQIRLAPQNYLSAEGESFALEETANSKIKIQELEGKIEQETTLGTNYFNASNISNSNIVVTDNGKTITMPIVTSGNGITGTGRSLRGLCPTLKVGDVVYLKFDRTPNNYNNYIYLEESAFLWGVNTARTITQTDLTSYVDLYANRYSSGETDVQVILSNFRIVKNNSDIWEKFSYGASPNPNYPQDIDIRTGRQFVDIRGKNKYNVGVSSNYVNPAHTGSRGFVSVNGNKVSFVIQASGDTVAYNDINKFQPNKTYTISATASMSGARFYIQLRNSSDTGWLTNSDVPSLGTGWTYNSYYQGWFTSPQTFEKTITIPNCGYWILGLGFGSTNVGSTQTITNIQVEEGSTKTTYEPYIGNTYEVNLGKNIFNKNGALNYPTNNNSVGTDKTTLQSDGTLKTTANFSAWRSKGGQLILKPNRSYTLSGTLVSSTGDNSNFALVQVMGYGSSWGNVGSKYLASTGDFSFTFNSGNNTDWFLSLNANGSVGGSFEAIFDNIQVEEGTQATSYSSYFEPIFLGEIGNYQDNIKQTKGYNLFNQDYYNNASLYTTNVYNYVKLDLKADKRYYVQTRLKEGKSSISGFYLCLCNKYQPNLPNNRTAWFVSNGTIALLGSQDFAGGESEDLYFSYYPTNISIEQIFNTYEFMISTDNVDFEPYAPKGTWFINKNIGKVVLNGTENWTQNSNQTLATTSYYSSNVIDSLKGNEANYSCKSNYFTDTLIYNVDTQGINLINQTRKLRLRINTSIASDVSSLKIWLSTHNTIVYYVLSTPTITKITNENYPELLSQLKALEKARTIDGFTYIESSIPISFQYDEKVVEDIDINSIMSLEVEDTSYKPYNAVTLALADGIEGENVTLRDESSIAMYGERALVITANEFAINQAVREELIKDMFNSINGFNYVPMKLEYNSYDWLERFDRIKVQYDDDQYYETYLFNHTTEFPSTIKSVIENVASNETNTKYEYIPETEQRGNHTEIVVDKLNGTITSTVSRIDDADDDIDTLKEQYSNISQNYNSIKSTVEAVQDNYDDLSTAGLNEEQKKELTAVATSMKAYVDQEIDRVTTTVTKTGGNNRIRNSVGFKGIDYWVLSDNGTATTSQSTDVEQTTTSGSEIILTEGTLRADYTTIVGGTYTVSFKFKKTSIGAANVVKIELHKSADDYITLYEGSEDFSDWEEKTYTYQATTATPYLIFDCGGDRLEISDLIANDGEQQSWSQYFDEVYGKTHQLDTSGLSLQAEDSDETSHLDNNNLIFEKSGTIRGELSGDRVKSDTAEITTTIKIGEFTYQIIDSNNMTLY